MLDSLSFARLTGAVLFASAALAGCGVQPTDAPSGDSVDEVEAVAESQDALSNGSLVIGNEWSSGCLTHDKYWGAVVDKDCAWDVNGHATDKNQRLVLQAACYPWGGGCGQQLRFEGTTLCIQGGSTSPWPCRDPFDRTSPGHNTIFSIASGAHRDDFSTTFMVKDVLTNHCMNQTFNESPFDAIVWGKCPAGPNLNNPNSDGYNWVAFGI
jgi:hypothetical protein